LEIESSDITRHIGNASIAQVSNGYIKVCKTPKVSKGKGMNIPGSAYPSYRGNQYHDERFHLQQRHGHPDACSRASIQTCMLK
jgi:hypothetical protein